ncbi:MAG TPA: LLM class F420-dependent oxidoreductase [Roseiflexaceae bacterium]|nr:LLM class F420-dependent oxidoreductase [Roseiflexaceae bacterium]
MRIGAVFPQTEIGDDPGVVREYAQTVEGMGFTHILVYDHVLGASTSNRPDWRGPYTSDTLFHEPFVLFGYLAGLTRSVELVTGVIILPQRQTALVAKQAAEVDVLSGGRMRLGVGVGWNPVEYEGLNENFNNRGARSEEQIEVLRALWSDPVVTFKGRWHTIDAAGIKPLPVQRPIPIWIGGSVEATLERVARLGDGWFPQMPPNEQAKKMIDLLRTHVEAAGRSMNEIGIEARLSISQTPEDGWKRFAEDWRNLGATHLTINTMGNGFTSVQQHLDALRRAKEALGAM